MYPKFVVLYHRGSPTLEYGRCSLYILKKALTGSTCQTHCPPSGGTFDIGNSYKTLELLRLLDVSTFQLL